MTRRTEVTIDNVQPNQPLLLSDACRIFFADALKPAALRLEAGRGNLSLMRIAGKDFVTPDAITAMLEKCTIRRAEPATPRASAMAQPPPITPAAMTSQEALRIHLDKLGENFKQDPKRSIDGRWRRAK